MEYQKFLIYKGVLVQIQWFSHLELYHWIAYESNYDYHNNKKFLDSLKQFGFEREQDAIAHAKREIDFHVETNSDD